MVEKKGCLITIKEDYKTLEQKKDMDIRKIFTQKFIDKLFLLSL